VLSIAAVFNGQKIMDVEDRQIGLHNKFIAPQARVLVVDDNAMNLKVMARLLLPYRLKVTMAGSGPEALEKLNAPEFDCVFLDHMMPDMDGVETLHKIRQKPGLYYQSLPVIAFTANAIGGAREMFLSEGFDDFIAKPIELSVLERILRRYIPSQMQLPVAEESAQKNAGDVTGKQTDTSSQPKASPPSGKSAGSPGAVAVKERDEAASARLRLTRAGINLEQALAYCGDEEGFREIIAIFHTEGRKRRNTLARYFKEQDWKNYVICVHALKGNAKGVCEAGLSAMARELEMDGKENRVVYILEHDEEVMENHDRLLAALDDNAFVYPDEEPPASAAAKEPSPFPEGNSAETGLCGEDSDSLQVLLSQIEEKLSSFESEGLCGLLDRLSVSCCHGASLAPLADEIRNLTSDFDFLGASEVLERMGK
ncbi:MAG: response regulator, partial [Lachnospiraceae bacterium]|nr:response regulator [Lachnospiraceae bacterium]